MNNDNILIPDGIHTLSGIGSTTITINEGWSDESVVDADIFEIDGQTYGAYEDPDDGYRSYGLLQTMNDETCQYKFPPQRVIVRNVVLETTGEWGEVICKRFLCLDDPVTNKNVLAIGTDFSDDYYPIAIFEYHPENLNVNQNRR